jgi:hypothetical protein
MSHKRKMSHEKKILFSHFPVFSRNSFFRVKRVIRALPRCRKVLRDAAYVRARGRSNERARRRSANATSTKHLSSGSKNGPFLDFAIFFGR